MLQSTHFELNLVEGSDKVNPLIQDVPNYQKIDEQMYKNQNAGVGLATELTAGTVHALTRAVASTGVFRFTATARYNYGDTFTVDGVSVTAKAPDGSALADGAYVIGGTVLCSLVGQLLVIYTNAVNEAKDSQKLGGELPSYYGTKAEVDNAQELAEGAATIAQGAIDSLSVIGDVSSAVNQQLVSLPNNTPVDILTISLPAGSYVVELGATFTSSANSNSYLMFNTGSVPSTTTMVQYGEHSKHPVNGKARHDVFKILKLGGPNILHVWLMQDSGATQGVSANDAAITVVRVK